MIKRLIFDVDGTLITRVSFIHPIQNTLKELQYYSEENVSKFLNAIATYEEKHNNYNEKDYLQHFSNFLGKKLNHEFLDIFFKNLEMCIPAENKKLIATIEELSKRYECVLLTNYFKKSQMNRLNAMGIGKCFKECFGEALIKPNKEAYITACGNHLPKECIMIGDHEKLDIRGAKRAGLHTILVQPVSDNRDTNSVADLVIDRVEDMDSFILMTFDIERDEKSAIEDNSVNYTK